MTDDTLQHALDYAARGWPVLPLKGKVPLTPHGVKDGTMDPDVIRGWWETWPDANVGIAAGAVSGFFVLDVDPRAGGDDSLAALETEHGQLPATVEAITGGGGRHLFFRYQAGIGNRTGIRPGLDKKGGGGYVVAPPSIHPDTGRAYAWEASHHPDDVPIAEAPPWLLELIQGGADRRPGAPVPERIEAGHRNDLLASLAGSMRRRGMSEAGILAALEAENKARCTPPLDAAEVAKIAGSVARYEPAADPETESDLARLAALPVIEYERRRVTEAERLGVRVSVLDKEVEKLRSDSKEKRGLGKLFQDVEPWHDPVEGVALLDDLAATFKRFCIMPDHGAEVAALWAVFTWALAMFHVSPRLLLTSPEKRCGKTTLLSTMARLACRALPCSNVSAAALFRSIEKWAPALLIDEADSFAGENEELRGILNSGHTRESAFVIRVVGEGKDMEPERFTTWAALVISMIGKPAGTVLDRSIVLEMRRKLPGEKVERLRQAEPGAFEVLRRKCRRWVDDHAGELAAARPELPEILHDRAQDNFEPLLQIALVAGGEWPARARAAALTLSGVADLDDASSFRVLLLSDIREYLESVKTMEWVRTADLLEHLNGLTEHPWPEFNHGKPLSAERLARMLKPFGVTSKKTRQGSAILRGYTAADFADSFRRYIPDGHPILSHGGGEKPTQPPQPSESVSCNDTPLPQGGVLWRQCGDGKSSNINTVAAVAGKTGGVERGKVSGGNGSHPGLCEHRAEWLKLSADSLAVIMANRMDELNDAVEDGLSECMARAWQEIKKREGGNAIP